MMIITKAYYKYNDDSKDHNYGDDNYDNNVMI